jgi:hypothetical protein
MAARSGDAAPNQGAFIRSIYHTSDTTPGPPKNSVLERRVTHHPSCHSVVALARLLAGRIDRGEMVGPRIVPAGFIEGESEQSARIGFVAANLDDVKKAIDWYAQRG